MRGSEPSDFTFVFNPFSSKFERGNVTPSPSGSQTSGFYLKAKTISFRLMFNIRDLNVKKISKIKP
jgi:hypothetical protein